MTTYAAKYFFDAGSGACLWADNEETREKYDYPIDHAALPIPENTKREISRLIAWYDTCVDWDDPAKADMWSSEEQESFKVAANALLLSLQKELGPNFQITSKMP